MGLAGQLTVAFILALHRLFAYRGHVSRIQFDNETNFVAAFKAINNAISKLNQNKIANHLLTQKTEWNFKSLSGNLLGKLFGENKILIICNTRSQSNNV